MLKPGTASRFGCRFQGHTAARAPPPPRPGDKGCGGRSARDTRARPAARTDRGRPRPSGGPGGAGAAAAPPRARREGSDRGKADGRRPRPRSAPRCRAGPGRATPFPPGRARSPWPAAARSPRPRCRGAAHPCGMRAGRPCRALWRLRAAPPPPPPGTRTRRRRRRAPGPALRARRTRPRAARPARRWPMAARGRYITRPGGRGRAGLGVTGSGPGPGGPCGDCGAGAARTGFGTLGTALLWLRAGAGSDPVLVCTGISRERRPCPARFRDLPGPAVPGSRCGSAAPGPGPLPGGPAPAAFLWAERADGA